MHKLAKSPYLHPFLFAAFPVLFLFGKNVNLVQVEQIGIPLAFVLLFTLAIFLMSWLIFRSTYKAGLVTSLFVILFFVYGPVFQFIQHKPLLGGYEISRHRQFTPIFILPLILLAGYLFKSKSTFSELTKILNITSLALLLPTVMQLGLHVFQPEVPIKSLDTKEKVTRNAATPDIYYFITDAYARADVLKQTFKFNNRPFLNALKLRGFYIAERSTSNYQRTDLSIPSTLNLDYFDGFIDPAFFKTPEKISIKGLIGNSRLRNILKENDYKYICFSSGIDISEIEDADRYFSHKLDVSEFEIAILNLTPVPDVFRSVFSQDLYSIHRSTVLYPFKNIKKAVAIQGPKFVQIHILSPHTPFVFDRFGNSIQPDYPFSFYHNKEVTPSPREYKQHVIGYTEQISFINTRLLQAIDTILKNSDTPPVIILQGDHGSRLNYHSRDINKSNHFEAFANLSTFYFPDQDTAGLYPGISNVNVFRLVLRKYFNADLPNLPDKCYYSPGNKPFEFTEVTDKVRPGNAAL